MGADKDRMGANREKVVLIGHHVEGVHCDKDGLHYENIVFISAEGWNMFQYFRFSLEAYWVLVWSILGESQVC